MAIKLSKNFRFDNQRGPQARCCESGQAAAGFEGPSAQMPQDADRGIEQRSRGNVALPVSPGLDKLFARRCTINQHPVGVSLQFVGPVGIMRLRVG
jgi:hypothetical protein